MGCRCDYIAMCNRDLERISQAKTYAGNLTTTSSGVDESMEYLKGKYEVTVKSSDDFLSEFDNVNKDCTSTTRQIQVYLGWVERTVKTYLQTASQEDKEYHEEEARKNSESDG